MLILTCPACGVQADETDLVGGGQAHLKRSDPQATDADFEAYLFQRENPSGVHFERWRHANGCGKWFHAARCTVTLEVFATYSAQTTTPPQGVLDLITKRRPGWADKGAK